MKRELSEINYLVGCLDIYEKFTIKFTGNYTLRRRLYEAQSRWEVLNVNYRE